MTSDPDENDPEGGDPDGSNPDGSDPDNSNPGDNSPNVMMSGLRARRESDGRVQRRWLLAKPDEIVAWRVCLTEHINRNSGADEVFEHPADAIEAALRLTQSSGDAARGHISIRLRQTRTVTCFDRPSLEDALRQTLAGSTAHARIAFEARIALAKTQVKTSVEAPVEMAGEAAGAMGVDMVAATPPSGESRPPSFVLVKRNRRLGIARVDQPGFAYTPPDFVRIVSRTDLHGLLAAANDKGMVAIEDVIAFESTAPRAPGYSDQR